MTSLILCLSGFIGICCFIAGNIYRADRRILVIDDPNIPLTREELLKLHIIPPEHYDEWLEDFARR